MTAVSKKAAAQHLLKLKNAEESFEGFVRTLHPTWEIPEFQIKLITALDLLERGELKSGFTNKMTIRRPEHPSKLHPDNFKGDPINNILINMPPRFAKSTFSTMYFPAYYILKNPRRYVMSCSYNSQLSTDFGRQVRNVVQEFWISQAFPQFEMSQDSRAADVWRTSEYGAYFGVGIGGTTSGRPANLLIVDDPVKAREEAESATMRNKIWDYYTSALNTRLQPEENGAPPKTIVILTRWHPDDLAGRLIQTDDWKEGRWLHINFPAVKNIESDFDSPVWELPEDDPRYIPRGKLHTVSKRKRYYRKQIEQALWPERFPLEDLKRRERLNPREFAALYQQTPYIAGGNILKSEWWKFYDDDLRPERFSSIVIAADTAFKKTETSDYSAFIVIGLAHDGDMYILDIIRKRYDFPELKQAAISLNNTWRGKGLRGLYIEDKASGQSLIQELKRESGISVIPYKVNNDKVARVNSVTPFIEGGRVWLPKTAKWVDDFIEETLAFPSGTYDDQVDALSIGLDSLSRQNASPDMVDWDIDVSKSLNNRWHDFRDSLNSNFRPRFKGWGL